MFQLAQISRGVALTRNVAENLITTFSSLRLAKEINFKQALSRNAYNSYLRSPAVSSRQFSSTKLQLQKETVSVCFLLPDGKKRSVSAKIGDNLLDVILDNQVDIDGYGACEGTLACSTCHLIFKKDNYEKLSSKPTDEELDMLDLAYGLSDTSRLGCQVIVTKDMDGWEISVPSGVADARTV